MRLAGHIAHVNKRERHEKYMSEGVKERDSLQISCRKVIVKKCM
jgi:hypothetical protein